MNAIIRTATKAEIVDQLHEYVPCCDIHIFERFISSTSPLYIGIIDDFVVGFWGLIPASLLSDRAYLWLHTTRYLEGNEFVFVRQSQIAVKEMLKHYRIIQGHTMANEARAIRWLKWLGAEFEPANHGVVAFTIGGK